MTELVRFVAEHMDHVCAIVIVTSVLGLLRLTRALRPVFGPSVAAQCIGVSWLPLLLIANYMVPPMGIWAVGFLVPLFADHHSLAWLAERAGPDVAIDVLRRAVREAGVVRYALAASIQAFLVALLGLLLITVSGGRNSWEYWLGYGVLSSAAFPVLFAGLTARSLARLDAPK